MKSMIDQAFRRYGMTVTVEHGAETGETHGFVQPVTAVSGGEPFSVGPLGAADRRCWRYLGSAEVSVAQGDHILCEGKRYRVRRAESGRTVEVYGRKLKMAASLDVYAPRRKGARGCEQTAEAVSEALLDGLADGLTLDELSWEKTEWDEEYGMFVRRGTARCTAYFVATADEESAVLTDFILKGVMQ